MSEPIESDDNLLDGAISGDQNALSKLLMRFGPQVQASLQLGQPWQSIIDVDDVMQVTYLEAFLRIDRLRTRTPAGFASWLEHVAQNNLRDAIKELDRVKRPSPRKRIELPDAADSLVALYELLGATSATPSREAAAGEARVTLEAAIGRLPPIYQQVIRMYDLDNRTAGEVAQALGRSEAAVYMLRGRAHDRLRDELGSSTAFFSGRQ